MKYPLHTSTVTSPSIDGQEPFPSATNVDAQFQQLVAVQPNVAATANKVSNLTSLKQELEKIHQKRGTGVTQQPPPDVVMDAAVATAAGQNLTQAAASPSKQNVRKVSRFKVAVVSEASSSIDPLATGGAVVQAQQQQPFLQHQQPILPHPVMSVMTSQQMDAVAATAPPSQYQSQQQFANATATVDLKDGSPSLIDAMPAYTVSTANTVVGQATVGAPIVERRLDEINTNTTTTVATTAIANIQQQQVMSQQLQQQQQHPETQQQQQQQLLIPANAQQQSTTTPSSGSIPTVSELFYLFFCDKK